MVTRAEAKRKLKEIIENQKPIKTGLTLPIRKGVSFAVYRVPLSLLVPNVLNDRITWKIREYEAENGRSLDINSEDDVEYLFETVLAEHPAENE